MKFKRGDKVVLQRGIFKGMVGVIQSSDDVNHSCSLEVSNMSGMNYLWEDLKHHKYYFREQRLKKLLD